MSKTVSKLALTASLVLAMAFIFSCSSDDGGGGGGDTQGGVSSSSDDSGGNSQSYSYCLLSEERICLDGPFTLEDCNTAGGHPSNSCPYGGVEPISSSGEAPSSSGVAPSSNSEGVSSSVETDDNPSSSGIAPSSGSVEPSSSSGVSSSVETDNNPSSSSVVPSSSSDVVTPSSSSEAVTPSSSSEAVMPSSSSEAVTPSSSSEAVTPSSSSSSSSYGSVIDSRDGKEYKTMQIDKWVWFVENLDYEAPGSSMCNNSSCEGRLYDWATAMTACPSGWHLLNQTEWEYIRKVYGISNEVVLWSANEYDNYNAYFIRNSTWSSGNKNQSFSVRCRQDIPYGSVTDSRDGKEYKTTQIDKQVWFAENLNYEAEGSKCYNNLDSNCDIYGRLYNWETAMTACPSGWHLPTKAEWDELGIDVIKLKAMSGWNNNGNGTDNFGFSALPGGNGDSGRWWSTGEYEYYSGNAYYWSMGSGVLWGFSNKSDLFSVRCLKN